ncbi:MAG: mechanosensitive ion channel [Candidatus Omnitrophica bacterium]|nr:mechanosensitive ion channel [Candidatus Omnitrophota bacterium]
MDVQTLMDKSQYYVSQYGLSLIAAVIIFMVGKWLAKVIANLCEKLMLKAKVEKTLVTFARNIIKNVLLVFVVIAALGKLGVQTTSLVAVIGAAGLAVGLALQGSLSNFAAGVMIILFKPFKVGDFIVAGGTMGTVVEIQIFNTLLNGPDNRREIVPNSQITGGNITNFSAIKNRRVDLVFGISYESDIRKAREVLEKVCSSNPKVLKDPATVIAVSELADSSVNLVCRPWCLPGDYWSVYFETLEKGKIELEKAGIVIPFPQRDVHLYQKES